MIFNWSHLYFFSQYKLLTSTIVLVNSVSDTPRCPSSNSGSKCRIIGSPLIAPSGQSSKLVKFVLFVKFCTICMASVHGGIRSGLSSSVMFIKTYIRNFYCLFTTQFNILKVALSQKILENFYISNVNIPNHYPEQKI